MPQETKKEKTHLLMERSDHTANCPNIATPLVTTIAAVKQARIMVALPWQKHTNPLTAFCVAQLLDRRRMSCLMNYGDAFVSHARNSCADVFLKSDLEWLLSIDDDLIFPIGPGKENAAWFNAHTGLNLDEKFAGQNPIDTLLSRGKTLIGGIYWGRSPKGKVMFAEGMNVPSEAEFARRGPHDLARETRWVATGFQLVHRSVFEAIEKKFPRLARKPGGKGSNFYSSSEATAMEVIDATKNFLARGPLSGETALKALSMLENGAAEASRKSSLGAGEDVTFCVRAKESGHAAFVDHAVWCGHVGQMVYHGKNTTP